MSVDVDHIHFTEMCCGTEVGSYLRLIDLLGPVTRVKKKDRDAGRGAVLAVDVDHLDTNCQL